MGPLGSAHLMLVLSAVALTGATGGFVASAIVRRDKRHARGFFVLGFVFGFMTSAVRRRRRHANTIAAVVRAIDLRPFIAALHAGTGSFAVHAPFDAAATAARSLRRALPLPAPRSGRP